jgi:cytidine deaminase
MLLRSLNAIRGRRTPPRNMIDALTPEVRGRLITAARQAAANAYCPFSRFRVGAAVLVNGEVCAGCNIENASYGLTVCAERVAIFRAIAGGNRQRFRAIAVTCPDAPVNATAEQRMPCGACRQVMAEFASPDLLVIVDGVGEILLRDLLPRPFSLASSEGSEARRRC